MKSIASSSATTSQLSSGFSEKLATLVRFVAVAMALSIGVIGCAEANPASSANSTDVAEAEANREASWFFNKMRVCVQNKTAGPISLKWNSYMQGDDGEYLKSSDLTKTLGPDAFNCAVSYASAGSEIATFSVENIPIDIYNDTGSYIVAEFPSGSKNYLWLPPGLSEKHPIPEKGGQQLMFSARVKEELRTVGHVKAYPVDVFISE